MTIASAPGDKQSAKAGRKQKTTAAGGFLKTAFSA